MQSKQSPGAPCCRHVPALTLQQVGDEQRRALVTAGQPPQRQVLLDLEREEVPVQGTGAALSGDSSQAPAQHSQAVPMPVPVLACAPTQGMQVWGRGGVIGGVCSPSTRVQLGTTMSSVPPPFKRPLIGFRANIPLCFRGHLCLLSGLMFCRSTVLVLFLVPVCNAFSEM